MKEHRGSGGARVGSGSVAQASMVPGKRTLVEAIDAGTPAVVQRRASAAAGPGASGVSDGPGKALPDGMRDKMERSFNADFGGVRVHEGPEAAAMGAEAFTRGHEIHFASGRYDPSSEGGQQLIGHELTHVVQQSQGRVRATAQAKGGIEINDDRGLEHEADHMGALAARGEPTGMAVGGGAGSTGVAQRVAETDASCEDHGKDKGKPKKKTTQQELQEILKKGHGMTADEALQARDLLFSLDGEAFRSMLKQAIKSGAFNEMLLRLGIWEAIKTIAKLSQQVVVPTTLLKPATDTIDDDFKRANEIYSPHGVEVKKGNQVVLSEKTTKKVLGADESLNEFTSDKATAEELKLIEQNRTKGRVTGYWVPNMTSSRGEMIGKPDITNIKADRTSVVVNTASRAQDTFAHELGHALGLDHFIGDNDNLMTSGSTRNITGPGIDKLTKEQLDIIMKSLFTEFSKLGGK